MKVAILAGGVGSRIQEETEIKPKPMVEIGGRPILWHIMKLYAHAGFKEFVIALGYKGDYIKRWMIEYSSLQGDLTVSLKDGQVRVLEGEREEWTVALVDTGLATEIGYEHVSYFSLGSLARLFRATGFELLPGDDQYTPTSRRALRTAGGRCRSRREPGSSPMRWRSGGLKERSEAE